MSLVLANKGIVTPKVIETPEEILEKARLDGKHVNHVKYDLDSVPTIRHYLASGATIRAIVGPRGSGKTSGAAWDVCRFIPEFMFRRYGYTKTRAVVVRNSYGELVDTSMRTIFDWFPFGNYIAQSSKYGSKLYTLKYREGYEVELLFRSCDRPDEVKKFKSMELTIYWVDESIEVVQDVKNMLKSSIGRYPKGTPAKFGIETTNPPDVDAPTYSQFKWHNPPPGPKPAGEPLEKHEGFWQKPGENEKNLGAGYYSDLRLYYRDTPDWADMYVDGKPGTLVRGKTVYNGFKRDIHEAKEPIPWTGAPLWRGWDNSGNCPACVVVQLPSANRVQVLREFHTDRDDIVTFTNNVIVECNMAFPNATFYDWGDPAGRTQFSKAKGGFTSNAELMLDECGIDVQSSEQNLVVRLAAVQKCIDMIDGLLVDPSCRRLINGFIAGYCFVEQPKGSGNYSDQPDKNRFSHPHDALQYVLLKLLSSLSAEKPADVPAEHTKPYLQTPGGWMR